MTPTPQTPALFHTAQLLRYMPGVQHQRQELRLIEAAWDNLSLLSSLSTLSSRSSSGSDLAQARHDFAALSDEMMRGLADEALNTALDGLGAQAQVVIDILVRNLFERTADIGFFATDVVVGEYIDRPDTERRPVMEARLRDYASKYTVYSDVFLFDKNHQLQARLQSGPGNNEPAALSPQDSAFLLTVFTSQSAYTESYAVHGFCDPASPSLVYAQPVAVGGRAVGVLCLQFKLADECAALFAQTQGDSAQGSDVVMAILHADGQVIHSSDALQLPVGWQLQQAATAGVFALRHLGRKYLAVVRDSQGFQGYAGPGWRGLAMLPLDGAFDTDDSLPPSALMEEVATHPGFLSGALSAIPQRSRAIQSALERSVWNGLLELNQLAATGAGTSAHDTLFAKTLLSEIGATAQKTAAAFASALHDLHTVVMHAQLRDTRHRADLAMQILDRNLYERANDCRWWALTPQFATTLIAGSADNTRATAILKQINALYTVYTCLVLFDQQGTVVAVSQDDQAHHVGRRLDEDWASRCLRLASSQDYAVSAYAPSRFYAQGPTYVYAAAVRDPHQSNGAVLGGIGIVWDAAGQMQSILHDCAQGMGERDVLAFVGADGQVLHAQGSALLHTMPTAVRQAQAGQPLVELQGQLYGVGDAAGPGYREFGPPLHKQTGKTSDHAGNQVTVNSSYQHGLHCLALRHLCPRQRSSAAAAPLAVVHAQRMAGEHHLQLATFSIAGHWMGIDARYVRQAAPDTAVLGAGNTQPPVLGVSHIGQLVYPVVDLRSMVKDGKAHTEGGTADAANEPPSRAADPNRQMLVLRVPTDVLDKHREFALRVDTLGSMVDIDSRQLQTLRTGAAGSQSLIDAVLSVPGASPGGGTQPTLLCRIALGWLQQCLQAAPEGWIPQDLDALTAG